MHSVLVIDDLRVMRDTSDVYIEYARTPDQGINILASASEFLEVYLDHDMGMTAETELTIRPVVKWIAENANKFCQRTEFYSISTNPWGKQWVVETLNDAGLMCYAVPDRDVHKAFDYLPWT